VVRNSPLAVPKDRTFGYFADELISIEKLKGERGALHKRLWANTSFYLHHKVWGATQRFNKVDIGTITTADYKLSGMGSHEGQQAQAGYDEPPIECFFKGLKTCT
jgi:hypothetical protein